jgi:hypothetical protein
VKFRPHEWVDILLNYSYAKSQFQTNFSLFSGDVQKGDRVPLVPLTRLNGTVNFHPLQGLEVGVTGLYVSRQVLLNDESNQSYYRIQDAFVLAAQASYTWKWFPVFSAGQ